MTDATTNSGSSGRHFDVCVIGSGSGNSLIDERLDDWSVALVDHGVTDERIFGGTCLNVGCIPTKMFVLPADVSRTPSEGARLGVDLELRAADWPAIRDRVFGRIDPIARAGEEWRRQNANVTLFRQSGRFVGQRALRVGTGPGAEVITADRFVLAAGSRAVLPPIDGIDRITVHTSDTIMRLDRLPRSMIIVGGGFVAAEFAHIFGAFGTDVTVVNRSPRLLRHEDAAVSQRFTEEIGATTSVLLSTQVTRFEPLADGRVRAHATGPDREQVLEADVVLIATGRVPNADTLDLATTGVRVADDGYVEVDEFQRTSAEGIFALGDICSRYQLKHVANHEERVVQHNLLHPDHMICADHRYVPHAVFSAPQVAAVGLTEEEAREQGVRYVTATQDYGSVAYGWALEDTSHFCKLLADPDTGLLLGAHIVGPQASTLIQPLIQAMHFGLPAQQMARGQYWIHPALPELIENALLALPSAEEAVSGG